MEQAGKTVMLVEDDNAVRQMQARILGGAGYTTIEAADGETALSLLLNQTVDLLVLDIMMPGISGIQVAEALKGNPKTANIPIVFVTAVTDTSTLKDTFAKGARLYLTKPFTGQQLLASVRSVIGGA